jgi:hypothetical protein
VPKQYLKKKENSTKEDGCRKQKTIINRSETHQRCFTKKRVMKTKQFTLVLLALVITIGAGATKIPKMNIVTLDDAKALVVAETDPEVASEISIEDANGNLVYYKEAKATAKFKSVFDLSNLEDGTYTVEVKTGTAAAKREVDIRHGEVVVKALQTAIDPYFAYDGDMLKVSYLNFDKKNLSLLIYKGSQLVFQSEIGKDFNVQRGFDVSDLVKGQYSVVLAGTGEDFSYRINR